MEFILRKNPVLTPHQIGVLIVSPTRELARQTHHVASVLCQHVGLAAPLLLIGGTNRPLSSDLTSFSKLQSDLVIGTPGRIDDVLSHYTSIDTSELEFLVLDEADILLSLGFEATCSSICRTLPKMRRTGLFSATRPGGERRHEEGIQRLINRAGLRRPVMVDVDVAIEEGNRSTRQRTRETPITLDNYYLVSSLRNKLYYLREFLKNRDPHEKILVFFLTCASVEFYGLVLQNVLPSYAIEVLHGRLTPKRRECTMDRFRSGETIVLLSTDIAARGLDVPNVSWTVQFDPPVDPAGYVHRVGRSGRAGQYGRSLLFVTYGSEECYIDFLKGRDVPLSVVEEEHIGEGCHRLEEDEEDGKGLELLSQVRNKVMKDRELLERGTRAFTSFVRAYKEHRLRFIFRFPSLDLGKLATSFALLKLPKMPELKDKLETIDFMPAGPEINIFAISYKDKTREKARQKRLKAELATGKKNAKQIKAEQRAIEKVKREKERRKKIIDKGQNPNKRKGRHARIVEEWDELAKEERLYKKLRSGKITKEKYREQMYGVSDKENGKSTIGVDEEDFAP